MVAASEALGLGYGGISRVSRACGLSRVTISKGVQEFQAEPLALGRIRRPGAGRPRLTARDPTLPQVLEALVEPLARGDPESPLRWTCKSTRTLARELSAQDHPDRDAQFQYINEQVRRALAAHRPVISVDTKKKELLGNYENPGRTWHKSRMPVQVNGHDFPDPSIPRAYPYGVYDLGRNTGFVNVGADHDTSRGVHPRLVACGRPASLRPRTSVADYGGWGRQQRVSSTSVEDGIAAPGG